MRISVKPQNYVCLFAIDRTFSIDEGMFNVLVMVGTCFDDACCFVAPLFFCFCFPFSAI